MLFLGFIFILGQKFLFSISSHGSALKHLISLHLLVPPSLNSSPPGSWLLLQMNLSKKKISRRKFPSSLSSDLAWRGLCLGLWAHSGPPSAPSASNTLIPRVRRPQDGRWASLKSVTTFYTKFWVCKIPNVLISLLLRPAQASCPHLPLFWRANSVHAPDWEMTIA